MRMQEVVIWVSERRVSWEEETARAKAQRQSRPDGWQCGRRQCGWREVGEGELADEVCLRQEPNGKQMVHCQ